MSRGQLLCAAPVPIGWDRLKGIFRVLRTVATAVAAGALLIAVALFVPSAALGACVAPRGPYSHSGPAEVVIDAVALDGPQSPARFEVRRYEKGVGPAVVLVETAVRGNSMSSEGIVPRAGERYRIFGTRTSGGVIRTGVCAGTRRIAREAGGLRLRAGARKASGVRSTYVGRGLKHKPRRLRVMRGGRIAITLQRPNNSGVISVISRSGRLIATATSRQSRRFSFRLPTRVRRPQTIVLDTGDAFYAVRVHPTKRRG